MGSIISSYMKATDEYRFGYGFRTGNTLNFYGHSLYWLARHVDLVNVSAELLKDGELLLYGTVSCQEFAKLVESGRLRGVCHHYWGLSWPYGCQAAGAGEDFAGFAEWRNGLLTDIGGQEKLEKQASIRLQ